MEPQWFANATGSPTENKVALSCPFFPDAAGVVFDTHSKMVMSQGGTTERMKEKVRIY